MPRVGPVYSLPAGYEAVLGEVIQPSQHNPPLEDIAQALTDSLPRNGTGPMTGNLAMGGFKITGGAAAVNPTDYPIFSQIASSAWLSSVSALSLSADEMVYASGTNTAAKTSLTAFARNLLNDADATTMRTTLGAQASDAALTSLAGLSLVSGDVLYATGADTLARLAKGSDGQVLTLASGLPSWAAGVSTVLPANLDLFIGSVASAANATVALTGISTGVLIIAFRSLSSGTLSDGPDIRLSDNNGGSWGSYQQLFTNNYTGAQAMSGLMMINLTSGKYYGSMSGQAASNTIFGTLTLPAGATNAIGIRSGDTNLTLDAEVFGFGTGA